MNQYLSIVSKKRMACKFWNS